MTSVLTWDKPAQAKSYEEWASYQADSAPPGTYQPNMSDSAKEMWKAKLCGQRGGQLYVEIRKSVGVQHSGSVQVKIVVHEDGFVQTSMNGTAGWSQQEFLELGQAVEEARHAMAAYRAREDETAGGDTGRAATFFTTDARICSMRAKPDPARPCTCCGPDGHIISYGVRVPSVTRPGTHGPVDGNLADWAHDMIGPGYKADDGRQVRVTLEVLPAAPPAG